VVALALAWDWPAIARPPQQEGSAVSADEASPGLGPAARHERTVRLKVEPPLDVSGWKDYRSPDTARRLSCWFTLAPLTLGVTMVVAGSVAPNVPVIVVGIGNMAVGVTFGPSVGYAYAGEHLRGWGVGALRFIGYGIATLALADAALENLCDECEHKDTSGVVLLGTSALIASLFSTIYDVAAASRAARRSNASHGIPDLAVVPTVMPSGTTSSRGLALVGRF